MSRMRCLARLWVVALVLVPVAEAIGAEAAPAAPVPPAPAAPAPPAPAVPAPVAPAAPAPVAPAPAVPTQETVWAEHVKAAQRALKAQDYPKAEAELMAAVKVAEGIDDKPQLLFSSLAMQIRTYSIQDKHADAIGPCKRLVAVCEKAYGADHRTVGAALNDLAGQYKDLEKFDEAVPLYTRSLAIGEKGGAQGAPLAGVVLDNLAQLYRDQNKLDDAQKNAARSLAIRTQLYGTGHASYADSLRTVATIHVAHGKHAEAETLFRQVLAIRRKTQMWNRPVMIRALIDVADACKAQENSESAEILYKVALRTGEGGLGRNDEVRAEAYEGYADLLKTLKRDDEAGRMTERAQIIRTRLAGPGGAPAGPGK